MPTYNSIDIAVEITQDLDIADIAPGIIGFWLRNNIGNLNNLLGTSYAIDIYNSEISGGVGEQEKAIFKKMYAIYYYGKQVNSNLGATAFDSIMEIASDGSTIRKVSKNQIAQTYLQLKKQETEELNRLVNGYKFGGGPGGSNIGSVVGDDYLVAGQSSDSNYIRLGSRGIS
jgi:hypothetical protein